MQTRNLVYRIEGLGINDVKFNLLNHEQQDEYCDSVILATDTIRDWLFKLEVVLDITGIAEKFYGIKKVYLNCEIGKKDGSVVIMIHYEPAKQRAQISRFIEDYLNFDFHFYCDKGNFRLTK